MTHEWRGLALFVLAVGEVLSLPVLYALLGHREKTTGALLAAHVGAVVLWVGSAAVLVAVPDPGASTLWMQSMNTWMNVAVLVWFLFVLAFTGAEWALTRRTVAVLSVEPLVATALIWTNDRYGLYYGTVTPDPTALSAIRIEGLQPAAMVHAAYLYALVLVGFALLVRELYHAERLYRGQAAANVVAAVAPWVANALYLFGVVPFDVTPAGFVVSALAFAVALLRYEFIDLAPVARSTVVSNLGDPVVVLDRADRVVDLNPAARRVLSGGGEDGEDAVGDRDDGALIGRPAAAAFGAVEGLGGAVLAGAASTAEPDGGGAERGEGGHPRTDRDDSGGAAGDGDGSGGATGAAGDDDEGAGFAGGRRAVAVTVDGERRHFDVEVSRLTGDRGRELGRAVVLRDVTERRRRRRELARQNERLDQFASLVSHDLRNPLTVADGYLDLAARAAESEEVVEHLLRVADSHERMEDLIQDVLVLAREGDRVTETEPVELRSAATEAWGNVDTAAATLDLRPGTGAVVAADRSRLLRAFENLFRNSVEHGSTGSRTESDDAVEHGGEDVTVRVGTVEADGPGVDDRAADGTDDPAVVGFYVADDGEGLPEADRGDVFEDGFTTASDGTGLGLSIVESVVTAHDWTIAAGESWAGGARFEVRGVDAADGDDDGAAGAVGGGADGDAGADPGTGPREVGSD